MTIAFIVGDLVLKRRQTPGGVYGAACILIRL